MKIITHLLLAGILSVNFSCQNSEIINCRIETTEGNIDIELFPEKAPITVENFMRYVDNGLYNGSSFFRVCTLENEKERDLKIEVIQGGGILEDKCYGPIILETTKVTGIKHVNGAISMARAEPNTATSSFFICIGDQPELDFEGKRNPDGQGFAAFGKVTEGMDIVKKIQQKENKEQMINDPVKIISIKRMK